MSSRTDCVRDGMGPSRRMVNYGERDRHPPYGVRVGFGPDNPLISGIVPRRETGTTMAMMLRTASEGMSDTDG